MGEVVVVEAFEEHKGLRRFLLGQCVQVQRWDTGTPARACSMCWPQPSQVGLPQEEQVIRAHMVPGPFRG
ncbi:hypothetical protein AKG07_14330 [Microbacterium sp. CGR1]|nr:hypothetical protein AKG07_14330 [Microbacterium sp. CGR1]KIP93754.1 hypothetical protein RU09_05325 [Microbacterium sp. MEJ108Y]MBC6493447.1 hypothetical protein [Microbacterium sp. 4-7]